MARHKRFSRHGPQRLENCGIPHSSASNVTFQHALALFFGIHPSHPGRVYDRLVLAAMLSLGTEDGVRTQGPTPSAVGQDNKLGLLWLLNRKTRLTPAPDAFRKMT
jgi:hypothetical protein